jgi:hypothetical protein
MNSTYGLFFAAAIKKKYYSAVSLIEFIRQQYKNDLKELSKKIHILPAIFFARNQYES